MFTMTGGEAVIETLRKEGIEYVFGIVGSSVLEIFDMLPDAGIKYVGVRHEQWAAHIADAYARLKRRPAVCLVQNGAGLTNLVTGVATAYRAHSPIVVISGTPLSTHLLRDTYQEIDQAAIMKPITKWNSIVNRPDRIPEMLRRAIREANTDPKAPTHVDIPRDFLYETIETEIWPRSSYQPTGRIVSDDETVRHAFELLIHSKFPVIIAGGGVTWSDAANEICELASLVSAPIVTSYGHNDAVPNDFPLFIGSLGRGGSKAAMRLLAKADTILAIGTRLDPFTVIPYYGFSYMPKDAKIIQVDVDGKQIGRNFPCEIGVVSDARAFLEASNRLLSAKNPGKAQARLNDIAKEKREWEDELEQSISVDSAVMLTERAYKVLRDNLPEGTIITTDIGSTPSFAYSVLRYKFSHLIAPLGLGGVGFAIPAALGAKLAQPEKKVVALLGDGAFTMEMNNLLTAVEYGIDITAIVFNNKAWGAEKANQLHFYEGRFIGTELERDPSVSSIAKALGVGSRTVTTPEELSNALKEALSNQQSYVIEVMVDKTSFPLPARRDALKKPARRIYMK